MRAAQLLLTIVVLCFATSCVRAPLLADAGDAVLRARASDATRRSTVPAVTDPTGDIQQAAAEAAAICARESNCPAVRIRRADAFVRADGSPWLVVRLSVCGEDRVYEQTGTLGWREATLRLR